MPRDELQQMLTAKISNQPEEEYEYKFLLNPQQQDLSFLPLMLQKSRALAAVDIRQKYLATASGQAEQRLRAWTASEQETFYFQTNKRGQGVSRQEQETPLSAEQYQQALQAANGAPEIHKRRYIFLDGGHKWELDHIGQYWLLELEIAPGESFALPEPLSGLQPQEVTGRKRWSNRSLAETVSS